MAGEASTALVADHIPLDRAGLTRLFTDHGHASTTIEVASFDGIVAALARETPIDVIAAAWELPGLNGSAGVRHIRTHYPRAKLIILAASPSREAVLECLAAGVHGYVPKSLALNEMAAAFDIILAGQIYVPSLTCEIAPSASPATIDGEIPAFQLTQRQRQVLVLLAEGRSNKEIARCLSISEGTVKAHINTAFRILGVHNRTSAVAALRRLEFASEPGEPHLPGLLDPRRRATDLPAWLLCCIMSQFDPATLLLV